MKAKNFIEAITGLFPRKGWTDTGVWDEKTSSPSEHVNEEPKTEVKQQKFWWESLNDINERVEKFRNLPNLK